MNVIPAVDLMGGRVVQLVEGDPKRRALREDDDPVTVARRWVEAGATRLHVVDLDAALGKGSNLEWVLRITRETGVPVWTAGGVRTLQHVADRLDAGAEAVVVGTRAMEDPTWFAAAARRHGDRLVAALDARDGQVVTRGWRTGTGLDVAEAAGRIARLPLAGILCTTTQVEGRMAGTDRNTLARLLDATEHRVVASGGIAGADDLRWLARRGAWGCVLGMALYSNRLSLAEAMAAAEATA